MYRFLQIFSWKKIFVVNFEKNKKNKKNKKLGENMEFYKNLEIAMKNLTESGAFLTVKGEEKVNTMTISWGYVGFSWGKPYFVAMVRPQRYTHEVMKKGDSYTISIPYKEEMKNALMICGTKSGREIDKEEVAKIKFISSKVVDAPIVDNCNMYYECKIKYVDILDKVKFPEELKHLYEADDYHYMYYGEIVECYENI